MEDISAVATMKDEAHHIEEFMASLADLEDIVIIDNGSTDGTAEKARKLGARVYEVGDRFQDTIVTADDLALFVKTFGFEPRFTVGQVFGSPSNQRNYVASLAKNDWVFNIDGDEVVEWDLPKLRAQLKDADQVSYVFKHKADQHFMQGRLYRRSKFCYVGRAHEVVIPYHEGARRIVTEHMTVEHHQTPKPGRDTVVAALEYACVTEPWERNLFYLGREYASRDRYEEAMKMLAAYIKVGSWKPEIAEAYYIVAQIHYNVGQMDDARAALLLAIGANPEFSEAMRFLAMLSDEAGKKAWGRYAACATDEGTLFVRG